ncbi:helix-turn-helix transcriptional regulator [Pseudomonas citronellolis]|uniref:helix-turn-helix transcriptional regulator n=1 Tax=Pseudomonas citronellolis TaxID=53408 RepID=UPI0038999305
MDDSLIATRLGGQIRQRRLNRGLPQAELASMAGPTRQTIIAIEKSSLSVAMQAYARPLGALDCEFALVPAAGGNPGSARLMPCRPPWSSFSASCP